MSMEVLHDTTNAIHLRRKIIDWRDEQTEKIHHHLSREINILFTELDNAIDKISIPGLLKSSQFCNENLQPIYQQWLENEIEVLIDKAKQDLAAIYQLDLEHKHENKDMKFQRQSKALLIDAATGVASTAVAVASIPSIVSLSTVSVGGVLGFVGVTSISWPTAIVGGLLAIGAGSIGVNKISKLIPKHIERYKQQIHALLENLILAENNEQSVCSALQAKIKEVANTALVEIKR